MERAIALGPNDADSYAILAETLSRVGRPEEAVARAEQALHRKPFAVDEHLSSVDAAYYLAGRPEEAVAPLKQYLARYLNILDAHLTLAAVYSELGREAEARAEAAEVLRINPKFSLEVHQQRAPIKDPAMLERHLAALRKAGLKGKPVSFRISSRPRLGTVASSSRAAMSTSSVSGEGMTRAPRLLSRAP